MTWNALGVSLWRERVRVGARLAGACPGGRSRSLTPGIEVTAAGGLSQRSWRLHRAARSVLAFCVLTALSWAQAARAEQIPREPVILRGDSNIAPVLTIFPQVFNTSSAATAMICVTNVNAGSEAQLQPGDAFQASFAESSDTVSPMWIGIPRRARRATHRRTTVFAFSRIVPACPLGEAVSSALPA